MTILKKNKQTTEPTSNSHTAKASKKAEEFNQMICILPITDETLNRATVAIFISTLINQEVAQEGKTLSPYAIVSDIFALTYNVNIEEIGGLSETNINKALSILKALSERGITFKKGETPPKEIKDFHQAFTKTIQTTKNYLQEKKAKLNTNDSRAEEKLNPGQTSNTNLEYLNNNHTFTLQDKAAEKIEDMGFMTPYGTINLTRTKNTQELINVIKNVKTVVANERNKQKGIKQNPKKTPEQTKKEKKGDKNSAKDTTQKAKSATQIKKDVAPHSQDTQSATNNPQTDNNTLAAGDSGTFVVTYDSDTDNSQTYKVLLKNPVENANKQLGNKKKNNKERDISSENTNIQDKPESEKWYVKPDQDTPAAIIAQSPNHYKDEDRSKDIQKKLSKANNISEQFRKDIASSERDKTISMEEATQQLQEAFIQKYLGHNPEHKQEGQALSPSAKKKLNKIMQHKTTEIPKLEKWLKKEWSKIIKDKKIVSGGKINMAMKAALEDAASRGVVSDDELTKAMQDAQKSNQIWDTNSFEPVDVNKLLEQANSRLLEKAQQEKDTINTVNLKQIIDHMHANKHDEVISGAGTTNSDANRINIQHKDKKNPEKEAHQSTQPKIKIKLKDADVKETEGSTPDTIKSTKSKSSGIKIKLAEVDSQETKEPTPDIGKNLQITKNNNSSKPQGIVQG